MTSCKQCAIVTLCSLLASFNTMPVYGISTSETSSSSDFPSQSGNDLSLEEQQELWEVVNNSLLSVEQRAAAERGLIEANDVQMLHIAFRGLIEPIEVIHLPDDVDGNLRVEHLPVLGAKGLFFPTTGTLEGDAFRAPVAAQIAYARGRIWYQLLLHAEPKEERHRVYEDLFEEAQQLPESRKKDWLFGTIMSGSSRNWTPKVREHLLSIYQNPEQSAHSRSRAGGTLLSLHHATPADEHRAVREKLIATAWTERGSDLALRMGQRLRVRDPRVAVLKLDWYDHEVGQSAKTGRPPGAAHMIDGYFGNVSGMHRDRRRAMTEEELEQRDKRLALMQEARETGDDTKLREFKEEIAEQQRKEFEQRVEKVNDWIKTNRERLEQEAEEFAEKQQDS